MNKVKLSISILKYSLYIYNTLFSVAHTQDISLFSIEKREDSLRNIAHISIPRIANRDIPIHLFDITSSPIPYDTHISTNRVNNSLYILSEWQINMDSLPISEVITIPMTTSCAVIPEELMHNFPEMENSFPYLIQLDSVAISLPHRPIDPLYYATEYTSLTPVYIHNIYIPYIEYVPLSIEKREVQELTPNLSLIPPFIMYNSVFSMINSLPSAIIPTLNYDLFDKKRVNSNLCFPQVESSMEHLQSIVLVDHLHIQSELNTTFVDHLSPQSELPVFSKDIQFETDVVLPTVHTSISKYISSGLDIPMIQLQINRPMTFIGPFHYMENFSLLPNLKDLHTISYRDEFSSTTNAMLSDTGEYYFSITLMPNRYIAFPPIPQTIFFLIDRSSHITSEQFHSFQRGVIQSLSYIPNNSRFNIAFFDQKISFLHSTDLKIESETIYRASSFVRSGKRFIFSPSNIYSVLNTIQSEVSPISHTTYILLTNRKSLQAGKNIQLLSNFIRDNREICTLYLASIGDNITDIPNVEESLYSDTHAAFPRRFATLVKNISFPIANHVKISTITEDPNLHIELFPNSHVIHQDKPFIIYGKMDHLKNFQLILQGNNLNSWINITKSIVFNMPCHSTKSLVKHFNKAKKSPL